MLSGQLVHGMGFSDSRLQGHKPSLALDTDTVFPNVSHLISY